MKTDKAVIQNLQWVKEHGQTKEIPLKILPNAHILRGAGLIVMDTDLKFALTEKGENYLKKGE